MLVCAGFLGSTQWPRAPSSPVTFSLLNSIASCFTHRSHLGGCLGSGSTPLPVSPNPILAANDSAPNSSVWAPPAHTPSNSQPSAGCPALQLIYTVYMETEFKSTGEELSPRGLHPLESSDASGKSRLTPVLLTNQLQIAGSNKCPLGLN